MAGRLWTAAPPGSIDPPMIRARDRKSRAVHAAMVMAAHLAAVMGPARAQEIATVPPPEDPAATEAPEIPPKEARLIRDGKVVEAQRQFLRRIRNVRNVQQRARMTQDFALFVYRETPALDDDTGALLLDLLLQAIDGFRLSVGGDDPIVATALMQRAEVERLLHSENPASWTDVAYQQAYRIRYARLGPAATETLSSLVPLAEVRSLPSRVGDDPEAVESAASLLRQVIERAGTLPDSDDVRQLRQDAESALNRLDKRYGKTVMRGRRPRIRLPLVDASCPAATLQDAIILSGRQSALDAVRMRFRKAGLDLQPCGALMVLPLGPGTDPTPVLGILSEISAGRVEGVGIGLNDARPEASGVPEPADPLLLPIEP